MAKRVEILFLEEIYESIDLIGRYVSGLTEKEFEENIENRMQYFAGLKSLERL